MRPDAVHTSVIDGVAWMDTKLLPATLVLRAATSRAAGRTSTPRPIRPSAAATLVAAFNAGFRMQDANGGYFTEGKTVIPLRTARRSFVIYKNGTATIGAWGTDVKMTPDVVAVRQNLDLLVSGGKPVPGLTPTTRPSGATPSATRLRVALRRRHHE